MRLLMIDGKTATLSRETKRELKYLNLTIDNKNFRYPKDAYIIDGKKRYFALYCRIHKHIYILEAIPTKK
jgi:hypothetical protein